MEEIVSKANPTVKGAPFFGVLREFNKKNRNNISRNNLLLF